MKKPIPILLLLAFTLFGSGLLSCGAPEAPSTEEEAPATEEPILPYPNFRGGELQGEKNFARLINNYAEGRVEPTPWAGFWWPYTGNGIASGSYGGGLSPAGKYDAARGGTTSAQMWEIMHHGAGVRGVQSWWGHCNGWTVASALFKEPDSDAMVNRVRFSVADQKALFTEAGMSASADFFGNRVDWGNDYATPKFTDTVPDQFFLLLTNYIGKLKHAVLIDRYTGDQVWNQPLAGYRFEYPTPADYLGADPAAPRVFRILLTSTIWWMRDDVPPGAITPPFNFELENEFVQSRALRMEVWLDGPVVFGPDGKITSSGDVIVSREGEYFAGGAWRIGDGYFSDGWPDYMWVPYSIIKPTDLEDDFVNIHVDVNWLKEHLLVPGGRDDPNASPRPVEPAPLPPSPRPTGAPTPTPRPTTQPTVLPTSVPTTLPTAVPTAVPTVVPTSAPTPRPTFIPIPTFTPTPLPTFTMTVRPTPRPTFTPTIRPTSQPTIAPTLTPTLTPTRTPTPQPTPRPTSTRPGSSPSRSPSG